MEVGRCRGGQDWGRGFTGLFHFWSSYVSTDLSLVLSGFVEKILQACKILLVNS